MKIHLVNIENGLQGIGFRKLAAYVRQLNPETSVYFVAPTHQFSLINRLRLNSNFGLSDENIDGIADTLSRADLVGFSFMSECREIAARIIKSVREKNPRALIISGGSHCRIYPKDALAFSDIVCDGEGEFAFAELIDRLEHDKAYHDIEGLHFNHQPEFTMNPPRRPLSSSELETLPFFQFDPSDRFYDPKKRVFRNITPSNYMKWLGLNLNIIWTRGCPNRCAYCYNSSFIDRHRDYAKIRYPSPRYMVDEIKSILRTYPMIAWISFIDDGMMAIKFERLAEFAEIYKKEIGLPFLTYGTHPNYIRDDKVRVLVKAGTIFFRMGIQNFNREVLKIYNRKTTLAQIEKACNILSRYRKYLTPPGLDIILDNDFAGIEDRKEHLGRIYDLPRPYILNLHSLRIVPGSTLEKNISSYTQAAVLETKDKNLLHVRATLFNIMHYLISVFRPPRWLFGFMLKYGCRDRKEYPLLIFAARFLFLARRALGNIKRFDYSFVSNNLVYLPYALKKAGILALYNRFEKNRREKL